MNTVDSLLSHYEDTKKFFPKHQIVCLALQGSQNYNLATSKSDVDTKLVVCPSLDDIVSAKNPVSYTYVRENDEHIDWKDIRLYIDLFRGQNPNYMEILFTRYYVLNISFRQEWDQLIAAREQIARLNPYRALHAINGMVMQKYHAMEHPYPSKMELIKKYGYDGKQVSHMVRLVNFMHNYFEGEQYARCLVDNSTQFLIELKENKYSLDDAREIAAGALKRADELLTRTRKRYKNEEDENVVALLQEVKHKIVRKSLEAELKGVDEA